MYYSAQELQTFSLLAGGALAFLLQFGTTIWRISKAESAIREEITEVERRTREETQELERKILETQLKMSEEYIRKEAFRSFMNNLEARFIRLEGKLDKALAKTSD